MTEFKTRKIVLHPDGPEISHYLDEEVTASTGCNYMPRQSGDVSLTVTGGDDSFQIALYEDRGYDRDNYPDAWSIEIDLNPDELHEVLLAATVWLEQRQCDS